MSLYEYTATIRFGDCDPAGILYYPRFFDLFHRAMEDWYGDCVGVPYHVMIHQQQRGMPSVHAQADFIAPARQGDAVRVLLRIERLGGSSVHLGYELRCGEALLAKATTVCVHMDLDPSSATYQRATPWPDAVRACFEAFQLGA